MVKVGLLALLLLQQQLLPLPLPLLLLGGEWWVTSAGGKVDDGRALVVATEARGAGAGLGVPGGIKHVFSSGFLVVQKRKSVESFVGNGMRCRAS